VKSNFSSTLVIVPARGGSKRIPNKNVRPIAGQPMIYWPLMTLSRLFSSQNVLVSTDSDTVKSLVEAKGLTVPFKRPKRLSDDFTGTGEVATHALRWFEKNVGRVDYVLIVYPTAVLLTEDDLIIAMDTLSEDAKADSVITATNFAFPIQRAIRKNQDGYAEIIQPEHYQKRSQDLDEFMHDAGQFYLSKADAVRKSVRLDNSSVKIHALHRSRVVDIDTFEDFHLAEERLNIYRHSYDSLDWSFSA